MLRFYGPITTAETDNGGNLATLEQKWGAVCVCWNQTKGMSEELHIWPTSFTQESTKESEKENREEMITSTHKLLVNQIMNYNIDVLCIHEGSNKVHNFFFAPIVCFHDSNFNFSWQILTFLHKWTTNKTSAHMDLFSLFYRKILNIKIMKKNSFLYHCFHQNYSVITTHHI